MKTEVEQTQEKRLISTEPTQFMATWSRYKFKDVASLILKTKNKDKKSNLETPGPHIARSFTLKKT